MMTDYKPGTVAVATVRGVPNVRIMRTTDGLPWVRPSNVGGGLWLTEEDVTDVRPLVVLDLEAIGWGDGRHLVHTLRLAGSNTLADAIEAQIPPPRIPEPGLWGVVEATDGPDGRYRFVRAYDAGWLCTASGWVHAWAELVDPVLIRDGIEESS